MNKFLKEEVKYVLNKDVIKDDSFIQFKYDDSIHNGLIMSVEDDHFYVLLSDRGELIIDINDVENGTYEILSVADSLLNDNDVLINKDKRGQEFEINNSVSGFVITEPDTMDILEVKHYQYVSDDDDEFEFRVVNKTNQIQYGTDNETCVFLDVGQVEELVYYLNGRLKQCGGGLL